MRHVFFNFQGNAVFGVVAFLGFGLLESLAAVTVLVLFARRKRRPARRVVDGSGRIYRPDLVGQRALESIEGPGVPLTRALVPGESYLTRLVFDLPETVEDPRLLVTESDWITRALIGHENSPLHRKTSF